MAEKARCEICDRTFKDGEGLAMHNKAKHPENVPKEKKPINTKKIKNWTIFIIIVVVIVGGIYWTISNAANATKLPPTSMEGHIEASPESHILKEPLDPRIQRHMLEHVDGGEGVRGGVILNYDCKNFECEPGLVENLENFANTYNYVYVAPFKNMPVKIALTKLGKIETLDNYDAIKIETFITGVIPQVEAGEVLLSDSNTQKENEVREININAKRFDFSPSIIRVSQGNQVKLKINNLDTTHGINIPDLGISGNNVLEFTADQKGTFTFYCNNYCGSGHAGMQGQIIVE